MQIKLDYPIAIVSELGVNEALIRQDVNPITDAEPES